MVRKLTRIQDVAREAGVSTATVSRALSNPEMLSQATRDAVHEAIQSTGYRVNRAARNLRRQQAGAVLVLAPNLGNPFFSLILAGISAEFAQGDHSVLIADSANLPKGNRRLVDYFLDSRIDGIISLDGSLGVDELAQLSANRLDDRLVFACEWAPDATFPSVRSDNAGGVRAAIAHLHGLGHRDIAHITGPAGNVLTDMRQQAFLAERHRLGLPVCEDWIIPGDFTLKSGYCAAQRLMRMTRRPSAVFCVSDMVALGLISGLAAGGLGVPGDMSVVGFDDIEQSAYSVPPLTTVRQDRRRLGARAAVLMRQRLDGLPSAPTVPQLPPPVEIIPVELAIRASTAVLRTP